MTTVPDREQSQQAPSALHIRLEVVIDASPETVWWALTNEVSSWWHHRFYEGSTLVFEPKAGGRFAELAEQGEALFATVQRVEAGRSLAMIGPMGMRIACTNLMTYTLEPEGEATRLTLEHQGTGLYTEEHRARYTTGWRDLLEDGLKAYCESKG